MGEKKGPIVSVIVPVYGVEPYLRQCMDSILGQTFTDFELIMVDDGSPDRCGDICDEYASRDNRVKVIHKENGGVSVARNAGLDMARGKYVAFCDADDGWHPECLARSVTAAEHNEADVVVYNYTVVDEQGQDHGGPSFVPGVVTIMDESSRFDYLLHGILCGRYGWSVCTRLFRMDIIRDHKIRFCTACQNYAEDLGFVFQFSCHITKASCISDRLYYYSVRQGSMMNQSQFQLKLDQMNEVSKFVYPTYQKVFSQRQYLKSFPIIHFIFMCPEYKKIVCTPQYSTLRAESARVKDQKWYRLQIRRVPRCHSMLKRCFGRNRARGTLLLAGYARHRCWKRFTIESAITYKWLIKGDMEAP